MGLFGKLFGRNEQVHTENFEQFKYDVQKIIIIAMKLLRSNPDGGFLKIFLDKNETEVAVVLMDTSWGRYCREHWNSDWQRFWMGGIVKLTSDEVEFLSRFAKISESNHTEIGSDVDIRLVCSYPIPVSSCKKWCTDYFTQNYSDYRLEVESNDISLIV